MPTRKNFPKKYLRMSARSARLVDIAGWRFGRLTAVARDGKGWRCRCTCGNEVVVVATALLQGRRRNCVRGAHYQIRRDELDLPGLTVQYRNEYNTFINMHHRCYGLHNDSRKHYGGRGITVCERWKSFANFLEDMGTRPNPMYTLHRIDNDGNYEPLNCKWASRKEQSRNTCRSVWVTDGKERMVLAELAERLELPRWKVYNRLPEGWTVATPLNKTYWRNPMSEWDTLKDRR